MKRISYLLLAFAITFTACKDEIEPELNLAGENTIVHSLNASFTDPGYTAVDDKDGDVTGEVKVTGTVDVDLVGDYTLDYQVQDEAGNEAPAVERIVQVRNDADHLDGVYFVSANLIYGSSTGTPTTVSAGSDKLTSSTTLNNRLFLDAFPVYVMYVDASTLNVPEQGAPGDQWSGSGTIDNNGDLILELNHENSVGGQTKYELYYTKN